MDPEDAAEGIMDQFDKNGDGGLQEGEMLQLVNFVGAKLGKPQIPAGEWHMIFEQMGGADGTVDKEQLIGQVTWLQDMIKTEGGATVLAELNIDVEEFASMDPEDAADGILEQFDNDGEDGLQKEEMLQLVNYVGAKLGKPEIPPAAWDGIFAQIPGCEDGTVTKDELVNQVTMLQ